MKLACLLTAAGSGSRFGSDKLRLPVDGEPMGVHALKVLAEAPFDLRVLITSRDKGYLMDAARALGFLVCINPAPERGMSSSVRLGTEAICAAGKFDGILYAVADQPHLSCGTINQLLEAFRQKPEMIFAPAAEGRRGNPVLFPASLIPELLQVQGDRGGRQVIAAHRERLRTIPVDPKELLDIDRKEDPSSC